MPLVQAGAERALEIEHRQGAGVRFVLDHSPSRDDNTANRVRLGRGQPLPHNENPIITSGDDAGPLGQHVNA